MHLTPVSVRPRHLSGTWPTPRCVWGGGRWCREPICSSRARQGSRSTSGRATHACGSSMSSDSCWCVRCRDNPCWGAFCAVLVRELLSAGKSTVDRWSRFRLEGGRVNTRWRQKVTALRAVSPLRRPAHGRTAPRAPEL